MTGSKVAGRAWLMVMIDHATSRVWARFYESEDTRPAFDIFGRYAWRWGLPQELYVDRDSIYKCTREARIDEELESEPPQTQFGRDMKQLGVELILANSPQAKGAWNAAMECSRVVWSKRCAWKAYRR